MNDEAARDTTLRQESFYKGDILVDRIPCSSNCKESVCDAGDQGSIPGLGSSSGEGNGNPLQYSCLEKFRDREAWWATVHGVNKDLDTPEQLIHTHTHTHTLTHTHALVD